MFPKGNLTKKYTQPSIKKRIEAFLIDNVGKVVTRQMIVEVSKDPITGKEPENWHQRLSELRTDDGYTILSKRDRAFLSVEDYVLESLNKRANAGKRVMPNQNTWSRILARANQCCEWNEGGTACGLRNGTIDQIGGGTVKLTPDHLQPHSVNPNADATDPNQWQALCGRHQVIKKNFWDSKSGKMNTIAIMQALPHKEKLVALEFLRQYFGTPQGKVGSF
ncbi:hypothetical protein [Parendozoicomonas sp. Alg238-R29]|uniref:hypothetical protein n=1 Tax=Parendozoicomonas sp. Alg238-R29 TaxID=2993446 RepID=UPI00248EF94B|nr:hypothetical protein [Parendozoicomonas sp. Alg238-R29]